MTSLVLFLDPPLFARGIERILVIVAVQEIFQQNQLPLLIYLRLQSFHLFKICHSYIRETISYINLLGYNLRVNATCI